MEPASGFGFIAILVVALILVRWSVRRQRRGSARRRAIRKTATSSLSARTEARGLDAAYTVSGTTTRREIEDTIPTIDEHGKRHLLIRTREVETVLGPVGPVEVERQQRLTLPGQGHVHALSDTEFEVFHNHMRLRVDMKATKRP